MNRPEPKEGQVYQHFKGAFYQIIAVGHHSETGERLVVYYAVGGTKSNPDIRPLEKFMSEFDCNKYPDVKQKYRFELM